MSILGKATKEFPFSWNGIICDLIVSLVDRFNWLGISLRSDSGTSTNEFWTDWVSSFIPKAKPVMLSLVNETVIVVPKRIMAPMAVI